MKIKRTILNNKLNIRTEMDFPKKGVEFIDINSLLFNENSLKEIVNKLARDARKKNANFIVCPEARGFLFGTAVAYKLGIKVLPIRKKGKLAPKTVLKEITFNKEYGTDYLELPKLINDTYEGKNFYIIDDVYATGNTIKAISDALKELGGNVVGIGVVLNIKELNDSQDVFSLIDINEG